MPSLTKVQTGFLEAVNPFTLASGTASAPIISFSDSAATGIFSPSTGVLGFSTGSTQNALRILSDGKVGIGTTNPSLRLDVQTTSSADVAIFKGNTAGTLLTIDNNTLDDYKIGGVNTVAPLVVYNNTDARYEMVFDGSGNLGIGTTAPLYNTHIYGSVNGIVSLVVANKLTDVSSRAFFALENDTGGQGSLHFTGSTFNNTGYARPSCLALYTSSANTSGGIAIAARNSSGYIDFYTGGGTQRAIIDNTGNVGIGTTNPSYKFDLLGTDTDIVRFRGTSSGVRFQSNSTTMDIVSHNGSDSNTRNLVIRQYGASTGILLDTNGNVGIGTTNPNGKLDVRGRGIFGGSDFNSSVSLGISALGEAYVSSGAVSNRDQYYNAGTICTLVSNTTTVNSGCLIDFNAYNSSSGATGVFIGAAAGPTINGPANFVVGRRTGTQSWAESLRVDTSGNVGIGTTNPGVKLQVQGDAIVTSSLSINGVPYTSSITYEPTSYFSMQQHLENNNLTCFTTLAGTSPTYVTDNNATTPYSKVALFSTTYEGQSDYIPVTPGETIYGEVWAKRNTGASGNAGSLYIGIARYDKDKNPIAINAALVYFVSNNITVPTNSTWAKYSGSTTLPTSHTPYNGSDGGPVRYIRAYIIVNYPSGTIPTYITGLSIKKQGVFGSENVGIGTNTPGAKLSIHDTSGSHITLSNTWSSGVHSISFVGGSSSSTGTAPQQTAARIICTATAPAGAATGDLKFVTNSGDSFVDALYLSPVGNVGIGTTNPDTKLDVRGSIAAAGRGLNVPHVVVKSTNGGIRYFEYYFDAVKPNGIGSTATVNIISVTNLSNFHQAAFTVEYGTRLQGVSDSTTSVCLKQFGVNKFNSGNVAITDTNDIASDTNSNTHGNVTCVTNGASGYIIRVEFSATAASSSFCSGVIRGWGVNDTIPNITFTAGP